MGLSVLFARASFREPNMTGTAEVPKLRAEYLFQPSPLCAYMRRAEAKANDCFHGDRQGRQFAALDFRRRHMIQGTLRRLLSTLHPVRCMYCCCDKKPTT